MLGTWIIQKENNQRGKRLVSKENSAKVGKKGKEKKDIWKIQ